MTSNQDHLIPPTEYLVVVPPPSHLAEFLQEARRLIKREPQLLDLIQADLDRYAKAKRRRRQKDREWEYEQHPGLPIDVTSQAADDGAPLKTGRPRMKPIVCYYFLMLRGYAGGVRSLQARDLFLESTSVRLLLAEENVTVPSGTTIIENTNAVSLETREAVLNAQLRLVLDEKLDDFSTQMMDSTSVAANTAWPTDSGLIFGLVQRLSKRGLKLSRFDLKSLEPDEIPEILKDLKRDLFQINNVSGRKGADEKHRELYRGFLDQAEIASQIFAKELKALKRRIAKHRLKPSRKEQLDQLLAWMEEDLANLDILIERATARLFEDEPPTGSGRILSISDPDAAFIKKGDRNPKIGYKPQLSRSGKGFVTDLIVPKGNVSDAVMWKDLADGSIQRTGVIPKTITVDSGYASRETRDYLKEIGVKHVSISGGRGKRMTDPDEWESEPIKDARRMRSAVESLMFQIKALVDFGEVVRRGINQVREELITKILAYNTMRLAWAFR